MAARQYMRSICNFLPGRKIFYFILLLLPGCMKAQDKGRDEFGLNAGVLQRGRTNAITDVGGVRVGHVTLIEGDDVRTGVTAILPHAGNIFREKVPAAIHVGNGFGKLAGYTQVEELGNLETPVVLTNTLAVPAACQGIIQYILSLPGNEEVRSVNPVVGETNDGFLNNIRKFSVTPDHVIAAIRAASGARPDEGSVGAGTGTVCFGFKGGIGTSSRIIPEKPGGYTVGVLVQTNFGGVLQINGVPVGKELGTYYLKDETRTDSPDGSCMIVVATDAPLDARNLERLAARAMLGLARTGGISSNGSGDYVIAFSTHPEVRISHGTTSPVNMPLLPNDAMSPLFLAVIEATEEAIYRSLFTAKEITGWQGHRVPVLPVQEVMMIMERYRPEK